MFKIKNWFFKSQIDKACDQKVNDMNSGSNGVMVQAALNDFTEPRN